MKRAKTELKYYIMCGDDGDFDKKLNEGGIDTSNNTLLKVRFYSKIGNLLRKEAKKRQKQIKI